MNYLWFYLINIGLFFLLERLIPKRENQKTIHSESASNVIYLIVNGHYAGTFIYYFSLYILELLEKNGIHFRWVELQLISHYHLLAQIILGLLIKDFLSWCVHNLLHRVPFLWQFHKVHHSAETMDYMVVMRFHWLEIMVYKTLLFIPLQIVGISSEAFLYIIFIEVFWGFFNHANLKLSLGWMTYVFNSPDMHIWHHERTKDRMNLNFGITLSCWDWIFKTVYWPKKEIPEKLSFEGIEAFPKGFIKQYILPLTFKR